MPVFAIKHILPRLPLFLISVPGQQTADSISEAIIVMTLYEITKAALPISPPHESSLIIPRQISFLLFLYESCFDDLNKRERTRRDLHFETLVWCVYCGHHSLLTWSVNIFLRSLLFRLHIISTRCPTLGRTNNKTNFSESKKKFLVKRAGNDDGTALTGMQDEWLSGLQFKLHLESFNNVSRWNWVRMMIV